MVTPTLDRAQSAWAKAEREQAYWAECR
jgi:hypothetical protein